MSPPPTYTLSTGAKCTVELVFYPSSGPCLEVVEKHDEVPKRRNIIYSEGVDRLVRIAEKFGDGCPQCGKPAYRLDVPHICATAR